MTKILFVCLGNICRSPLAEAILKQEAQKRNIQVLVDSSGTSGQHKGENPDPRAIRTAQRNQIPISHTSQKFRLSDFESFDAILAMDTSNFRDLLNLAAGNQSYIKKLALSGSFASPPLNDVPDPWFGAEAGFQKTVDICKNIASGILDWMESNQRLSGHLQGLVQGVSFRVSAQKEAKKLGLSGWVKNVNHSELAFEVQGPISAVNAFKSWSEKGPLLAKVEHAKFQNLGLLPNENLFEILG